MIEGYPFGRGGGGAPNRNKKGDVQAFRRNLISDMRYNQSDINVDDDFDEVRRTRKNYNIKNDNINHNRYNPMQKSFSKIIKFFRFDNVSVILNIIYLYLINFELMFYLIHEIEIIYSKNQFVT